ncbi:hypothetical protein FNV43_RR04164 [Rhamnella rubrinervis]|uniref:Phytocyanin domain-containing protein n=1 Tax=Rhamnella rubrinervis TaxID=2594499 RepID=A0A8K0HKH8_9ROSA|nr:hypothetical protein FNV43_RR04164 [Rhamnella rubrinervis]
MGSRGMSLIGCVILLVGVITLSRGAEAATYLVGDDQLWHVPSNVSFYSDWAASKTFGVGDLLKTTKTQYDNCEKPSDIKLSSSGNVSLTATGSKYFICTVGDHCSQGQKLAINVTSSTPSTPSTPSSPPPPPPPPSSSVSSVSVDALFATMSVLLVHFLA